MSVDAISASPSRRPLPGRGSQARARHEDAINPARGVMVGLGLSALIWTSLGALLLR